MPQAHSSTVEARLPRLLAGLVILSSSLVNAADVGPTPAAAKEAVRQVLDDQVAAWNKGDLDAFMAGYWKSPDLTFFSGKDRTQGWEATLQRYRQRYQAEGKEMGKLTFSEVEIEALGPESAWIRGRWRLVTSKDTPEGRFTLICKKLPEGWRIVHDHTSGG